MRFIITGHANYASGVKSALDLILGTNEIEAIDFDCELDVFKANCINILDDVPTIVMCDLLGGTPFNTFAYLAATKSNVSVITHISIAAIIENYTIYKHSNDLKFVVSEMLKISSLSIKQFELQIPTDIDNDEGI